MDDATFDRLSRRLAALTLPRRATFAQLAGATLAVAAGTLGLAETAAKPRRKKSKPKRNKKKKKTPPSGCTPQCTNRNCGDDGCGGSCGRCLAGAVCSDAGVCQTECTVDCEGKDCGGDGCGGSCGSCANGFTCAGGVCTCPDGACGGVCCGNNQTCVAGSCCPNDQICAGACCPSAQRCVAGGCCATDRVCGNACCASGHTCLGGGCCPSTQVCNGACCPSGQQCVGGTCCPTGRVCNGTCCTTIQTCLNSQCCATASICAGVCCAANATCIAGQCCPSARVCGSACCGTGQSCVGGACRSETALDNEEAAFLTLINDYRAANNRAPLAVQSQLTAAAERHSQDQAANGFSGHTGSDGSTPDRRISDAGYRGTAWGENVYWNSGDGSASAAFTWWKNSPLHNANMLSANFTEIGIARVRAGNGRWYWTTTFGRR